MREKIGRWRALRLRRGWSSTSYMPLELAHAQLLETGLFQPTSESFSRDAPEINRSSWLQAGPAPSCGFCSGAGGLVGSEGEALMWKTGARQRFGLWKMSYLGRAADPIKYHVFGLLNWKCLPPVWGQEMCIQAKNSAHQTDPCPKVSMKLEWTRFTFLILIPGLIVNDYACYSTGKKYVCLHNLSLAPL